VNPLVALHTYLRGVDERRDAVETTPWIRDDQREACREYLADEALSALDQVPPGVIAESWSWYIVYGERGRVEELHDVRGLGVAGVPEGGRYD
jgi:hypothetical protein